jgi:hypothetical protein
MAKIKKKLSIPPKPDEVKHNLDEPDFEPEPPKKKVNKKLNIDGRSLRKTGFNKQFNTKVPTGFKEELTAISKTLNLTYGKILVDAVNFYKKHLKKMGKI